MYCLRNQEQLEEKLDQARLLKMFEFISRGSITKKHIEKISYKQNMNVVTTFNDRAVREKIEVTLERMLDRWYEDKYKFSATVRQYWFLVANSHSSNSSSWSVCWLVGLSPDV